MTPKGREIAKALAADNPPDALRDMTVSRLTADGQSREEVLGELEDLRADLENQGDAAHEEVVMSVMDQLVGFCSPQWSLASIGYSEYEDPEALD